MFVIWITLVFVFMSWLYLRRKKRFLNLPPGPPILPVLGSLPFINVRRGLFDWALDVTVTRHKLATVGLGPKNIFVINDLDLAKELFSKEEFSGRMHSPFILAHKFFNGKPQGVAHTEGSHWAAQRRFSLKTLKDFGFGKQSLEETINIEASKVIEKFLSTSGDVLMSGDFEVPVINALWQIVAGSRFNVEDPVGMEMVNSIGLIFKNQLKVSFIPLKILKTFPTLGNYEVVVKEYDAMKDYIMKTIEEHKCTIDQENPRDFIDVYLNEIAKGGQENPFNKEDLAICMMDFLAAGTDTTSSTLKWTILFLTLHQDVQNRCREEIVSVLGDSSCKMTDMPSLPYVQATILEVQRRSRVAPFSLIHKTNAKTQVGKFSFPPVSLFVANISFITHDPRFFHQPEMFNPERMIGLDGRFEKNERIIPFGVGKRNCMGELLARNELFLFTVNLIQNVQFLPPQDNTVTSPENFISGLTHTPCDFFVRFVSTKKNDEE